jgi:autotransporter-associated beta strand protein
VVLTGSNNYEGGTTVNGGTLVIGASGALANENVAISGGMVQLGQGTGLARMTSLSISGNGVLGGVLDIVNNHVIITYGPSDPVAAIEGYIQSGYNNGRWNGVGIISSAAQSLTNGLQYGVGWADGADGVVAGISSGQIEIKYTLLGDANLDGVVNGSDFSILAANFGLGHTNWDEGDFLFTSSVNGADFSALATNFGQGDSGADGVTAADIAALDAFAGANGLMADVPEPCGGTMAILAGLGALGRRKRRG